MSWNRLTNVTGTVVYSQNHPSAMNYDGTITDNILSDCAGTHANGITVYGGASSGPLASNVVIARNLVIRQYQRYGPFALSLQGQKRIQVENNVFDGGVADDGAVAGSDYMNYLNNTVSKTLRVFRASNSVDCVVKNNICIEGLTNDNSEDWADMAHSHNIFVTRTGRQAVMYGWSDGTGESDSTLSLLFGSSTFTDGIITSSSSAYNVGTDLSSVMVTDLDPIGTARPQATLWDIGAYEYTTGGGLPAFDSSTMRGTMTLRNGAVVR